MIKCPVCGKPVPPGIVVAYSNGMECPHCHSRVEVSTGSAMLPTFVGLIAGFFAYELSKDIGGPLGFVLPVLYSILAYGAVTPLFMMLTAHLEPAPEPVAVAAAPAAHGHH